MTGAQVPVPVLAVTPVVSWPRQARPGGRYLISVDLRFDDAWPYQDEEEYVVALMLSGRDDLQVSALGDTSVVLHRFGGTYGPARFVATVEDTASAGARTGLWLTLISAGGVPFHTAQLPIMITHEAPQQPVAAVLPARPAPRRLPILPGGDTDVWSMVAFSHDGQPTLAIGGDNGVLRVWQPATGDVHVHDIAPGRVHVAALSGVDGQVGLVAGAGNRLLLLDPVLGQTLGGLPKSEPGTVTALAWIPGSDRQQLVAAGYDDGRIHLLRGGDLSILTSFIAHTGAVFSLTSLDLDGRTMLVSAGLDASAKVWDIRGAEPIVAFGGHQAQINCVTAVTGEHPSIATASDDGTVRRWDLVTRSGSIEARRQPSDWINTVVELPGRGRRPVLLWGAKSGALGWGVQGDGRSMTLAVDTRAVTVVTPLQWADRRLVAVARAGGEVRLHDADEFRIDERRSTPARSSSAEFDAVVVIPSVMGSELVETATGQVLWGLADVRWYLKAWVSGSGLRALCTTDDERAGIAARIRATRLLRTAAVLPGFAGIEPYTPLVRALRRTCRDPAAVMEFPYDWRLPVTHNALALAEAAQWHLEAWRRHPSGSADARLVLVAHGGGGLIARAYVGMHADPADVRLTIGMGVPYRGTVRALELMSGGRGGPLPLAAGRMRALAVTLPGFYDLLPSYACVQEEQGLRHLTPSDVADLGGDGELAADAFARNRQIQDVEAGQILSIVGIGQPTPQSVRLQDGVLIPQRFLPSAAGADTDEGGDGTVPRFSAVPPGESRSTLSVNQTAGGLCQDAAVIGAITGWLTERAGGLPL